MKTKYEVSYPNVLYDKDKDDEKCKNKFMKWFKFSINIIIFINILLGTYERRGHYDMVEKVGLYWHFVDLVWVFVFTFFYLV